MRQTDRDQDAIDSSAAEIEKDKRARIKAYFSGEFHEQHRRWRLLKQCTRGALLVLGGALWLITIPISLMRAYELSQHELAQASLFEVGVIVGGLFLAGGALIVLSRWNRLWHLVLRNPQRVYCWLVLAPAALIAAWVIKRHFGFSDVWQRGLGIVALGFLGAGFMFQTRELPPEEEMERDLDTWLEADIARHAARIGALMRPGPDREDTRTLVLKAFPMLERRSGLPAGARIGHDNRPRITPAGFMLLKLGRDCAVSFEGAIDLFSGELIYHRMHEFAYADIAFLGLTCDLVESERGADGQNRRLPGLPLPLGRQKLRHKDVLRIGLNGGTCLEVVLRHSGYRDTWATETEPLNDPAKVREAWALLSERHLKAASRAGA